VCVIVTPGIRRADSFVRREIAFVTDWDRGLVALLERLKRAWVEEIDLHTRREHELALHAIVQCYDHRCDLYTDMAAQAQRMDDRQQLFLP
jgi:predicted ATPase